MSIDQDLLLCLKCRSRGHLVSDCFLTEWTPEVHWTLAPESSLPPKSFDAFDLNGSESTTLCNRCVALDLLSLLDRKIEWASFDELNTLVRHGRAPLQVLGKVGSIEYLVTCPLCRCLFALTPNPLSEDQDIVIFTAWTILRLEGSIVMDTGSKQNYSKCLIVTLQPLSPSFQKTQFANAITRGDALCLLESHRLSSSSTLNARRVRKDAIDLHLIQNWLTMCQRCHPFTCRPHRSEALQDIRLIDCHDPTEHHVVSFPEQPCDYFALSYVWGGIEPQSFGLGPIRTGTLPQTIEDAATLVRQLGKRYLWCDLVCIDQLDAAVKTTQIAKMADIYRGAYATIVAMSSRSARTGLPKMGQDIATASQLECKINGRTVVSLMPALTQLIWVSPWGQRSWTLQEALLSRRCIILSEYQMYFECNGMECCESQDESRSWIHQSVRTEYPEDSKTTNVGTGCLRFNPAAFNLGKEQFLMPYGSLLELYSYRSMSDSQDAINAFAGMLQDFREDYDIEFHFGLPLRYFQWGLLWTAQTRLERRPGFPSWSWAGWIGPLWQRLPLILSEPAPLQTYLTIHRMPQNENCTLFKSTPNPLFSISGSSSTENGIDFVGIGLGQLIDRTTDVGMNADHGIQNGIIVEGIVLRLHPRYNSTSATGEELPRFSDGLVFHRLELMSQECIIAIEELDIAMQARMGVWNDFLLVTREYSHGWMHYWLLLIERQGAVAQRVTTLRLSVRESQQWVLRDARPERWKFILI